MKADWQIATSELQSSFSQYTITSGFQFTRTTTIYTHSSAHSPIENLHFTEWRFSGGQPRNFSKTQINPPYFISRLAIMRSYFG